MPTLVAMGDLALCVSGKIATRTKHITLSRFQVQSLATLSNASNESENWKILNGIQDTRWNKWAVKMHKHFWPVEQTQFGPNVHLFTV